MLDSSTSLSQKPMQPCNCSPTSDMTLTAEIGGVYQGEKNPWLSGLGIAVPITALWIIMAGMISGGSPTPMGSSRPFSNQSDLGSRTGYPGTPVSAFTWQNRFYCPSDSAVRRKLRTDEDARRRVLEEAIASFAFEGIQVSWEDASELLDQALDEPPIDLIA